MAFDLDRSLEVLERTPRVLQAMLGGVSDFWAMNRYGESTFSPFDVVGHLIHADRTNWVTRLRIILDEGEATPLPAFDRYAMIEANRGRTMAELLERFAAVRAASLDALRGFDLTSGQLQRRGRHPELGVVTAKELIAAWVVHDLGHTHQVAKAMAYQYRDAVGAWRTYLTILPRGEESRNEAG